MSASFPEEAVSLEQEMLKSHKEILLRAATWLHYKANDVAIGLFT